MSSKQFTAQTFAWLRLLKSDRDLTALAVGVQLTEHFNEKEGGVAYPGSDYMAEQLGMSQSTVVRALHRMHERGRIRVEWGKPGRGCSNRIWMIVKHAPEHVSKGQKHAPAHPRKHAPESKKTCAGAYKPLLNHNSLWGRLRVPPQGGRERRCFAVARIYTTTGGWRTPDGAAPR